MNRSCTLLLGAFVLAALSPTVALAGRAGQPAAPDAAPGSVIQVLNRTWHCTGMQRGTIVNVTVNDGSNTDGVMLDQGCTGILVVHVLTNGGDGVKVHDGAHDLQVTGGITCNGRANAKHQDGVQAMGGNNVLFGDTHAANSFKVSCPTGNNGGMFFNPGDGGNGMPTNIVCDHCNLYEGNVALNISTSRSSGARNSILHMGTGGASPPGCLRIRGGAVNPVNTNNTCVA
jgi:hypothetical protein